uniref:Uncharacterized protein n=1 Tax=Avena sativa TaxID=4498 RepID=A0ACD5YRV1_AVESA
MAMGLRPSPIKGAPYLLSSRTTFSRSRPATNNKERIDAAQIQTRQPPLAGDVETRVCAAMDSDYGVPRELSEVQKKRTLYQPELPPCLQGTTVRVEYGDVAIAADPAGAHVISHAFPHTYGQPLAHFLRKAANVADAKVISEHPACSFFEGVTSNTDAAQLAETFAEAKCATKVVGVPVTLNGDLKNQFVETTVGFDTICKVNSQLISNMCTDALSAEKYYYFIRMMGRKASHVALECALQSHPNMVILGEEVAASKLTIFDITKQICDAVQARAEKDKNHGVILIPEGLVESIPELYALLQEINGLHGKGVSIENISSQLSPWASALFEFLPQFIRHQLLLRPESDDSAQLSQIETEKLLAQLVETEMNKRLVCIFNGLLFSRLLRQNSSSCLLEDIYRNPGPLQFEGPGADSKPISLCVEDQDYMGRIKKLQEYLEKVKSIVKPGCSQDVLKAALSAMSSVTETLAIMTSSSTGQAPV